MNRLRLFGGGVLEMENGPIVGRAAQRHRIALLALLSTTRRLYRSRDQLITFLWPDTDAERGRKLLSDSVYRINHVLGGDVITGTGDDLRLNRARVSSDVADFEAALESRDWKQAVELHAGPFLDGFYLPRSTEFEQWMEKERGQYARAYAKSMEMLATEAAKGGSMAEAVDWWQRLAATVPDDSRIAVELMRALEQVGNRPGALRHVRVHALQVRESLGVEPDRSVRELADQIMKRGEAPSLAAGGRSVAVLPFVSVGDVDGTTSFADGVTEEVMYLLTRIPGLHVASRTSAYAYRDMRLDVRDIGRRLGVEWMLEGSVRRSADTVRVVVQLTEARSGYQLWSEAFERSGGALLSLQADIAGAVADWIGRTVPAPTVFVASACDLTRQP